MKNQPTTTTTHTPTWTPTPTPTQDEFLKRFQEAKTSKEAAVIYAELIEATTLENANAHGLSITQLNAFILSKWAVGTFKNIKQAAWKICDQHTHDKYTQEAAQ